MVVSLGAHMSLDEMLERVLPCALSDSARFCWVHVLKSFPHRKSALLVLVVCPLINVMILSSRNTMIIWFRTVVCVTYVVIIICDSH